MRMERTTPISTIWGTAQTVDEVCKGLIWTTTASHGGFRMTATKAREMPAALLKCGEIRRGYWWFEEDCAACAVVLGLPADVLPWADRQKWSVEGSTITDHAKTVIANHWPEAWESFFGAKLEPAQSYKLRAKVFAEENAQRWVVVAAWGDWQAGVPAGYVGVCARKGGRDLRGHVEGPESWWLVPAAEYAQREEFGFVIDEARHIQAEDFTQLKREPERITCPSCGQPHVLSDCQAYQPNKTASLGREVGLFDADGGDLFDNYERR